MDKIKLRGITEDRLKYLLSYDEYTGMFTWINKSSKFSPVKIGQRADKLHKGSGYYRIQIDGERYAAHRLAWLFCYGELPEDEIDHINTDRSDNSKSNLRLAQGKNAQNAKINYNSQTGVKGVTYHPATGKYAARIQVDKVMHNLGLFSTVEAAQEVLKTKREDFHGEYANHG
jgi:hypothetical protein